MLLTRSRFVYSTLPSGIHVNKRIFFFLRRGSSCEIRSLFFLFLNVHLFLPLPLFFFLLFSFFFIIVTMNKSSELIQRPTLLRSLPSTQITTCNVHAHKECNVVSRQKPVEISRTQHKLMLQRQSFLADDKNYLDHPDNMRRLTKELDRVNREYKCLKQYQDPFVLSLKRVMQQQLDSPPSLIMSPISSASSSPSSSSFLSIPPRLQRRGSSQTMHESLMIQFNKEERRHSLVQDNNRSSSPGFMSRLFSTVQQQHHHPPLQFKRHPHLY